MKGLNHCGNYDVYRTMDVVASKAFPEFNIEDFKSSCLNSNINAAPPVKNTNEVLLPASVSMPAIASAKTPPQLKFV